MAHDARASSMGTTAWPKRRIPERSPSALSSAWPSASPVSSTVWCGPVSRSPWTWTSRSRPPWRATASSRWSKKPTPVWRSPAPVPSRARESETSVSPVTRWMWAGRLAGGAAGGEHVVGAGDVVAEGGAGAGADEDAAGAGHAVRERLGLLADQLEVLGGDLLRRLQTGTRARDLDRLHVGHPVRHGLDQRGLRRDQPELAVETVLRLCEQVQSDQLGVRARGGEHGQLARSGEAVDAHLPDDLALRLGHPRIAGPDDHVDSRDRLGAVRQRGDRLRPAHPVHLGHLTEHARSEDRGVRAAAGAGGRAHGHLLHARHPCGYGGHDHGRWGGRPPARPVDPGAP